MNRTLTVHIGPYLQRTRRVCYYTMAPAAKSEQDKPAPSPPGPRIPLRYIAAPVQRLYVLSFGALLQVCFPT